MNKTVLLAVLVAISALVISGCSTFINRPGMTVQTDNPFLDLGPVLDPNSNYVPKWIDDLMQGRTQPKDGDYRDILLENNRNYPIRIEIEIDSIDGVNIQQILNASGSVKILPGYEPVSKRMERRTTDTIRLQHGDYMVRVKNLNRPEGKNLEFNDMLHVDIKSGKSVNQNYDTVFSY